MSTDIHALSGAYALDALDPDERAEFEKHLAGCEICRAEVDSLREAAAGMAELVETAPPAGLRAKVLSDVAGVRPLPPLVDTRRRRRRWTGLLAVAATVAALGAGAAVWHPWEDREPSAPRISAVERVAQAPDAVRATQRLPGGGTVTVYRSVALDKAAVVVKDLDAPPQGKVYEMWLQDASGSMEPAGVVPAGVTSGEMVLEGRAAEAVGAGITVEPEGGSTEPTSDPVAVLSFGEA